MNNNKTGIIWGLSIVIVILLIVCILFATNVISLNTKKEVKKEIKTNTTKKEYVLSKDDALAVVKNKFDYTKNF